MQNSLYFRIPEMNNLLRKLRKSHLKQYPKRINLTKEVKDLYVKNYKTFLREIKEELNKQKDNPCPGTIKFNIVTTAILPKKYTGSIKFL